MKKKFFALMMACVMTFAMTACGGGSDTTTDGAQTPDQGSSENIVIGTIGPLTGPYANYGLSVKQGAEVA
ncbi:MAG: ABC transporter substrate-binding protein, partial [Christensenellaceae bacterium]|nr:ABC transporter substrate-binding protein [Christensenellaceae bacterium]